MFVNMTTYEANHLIRYFLRKGIDDEWVRAVAIKTLNTLQAEAEG